MMEADAGDVHTARRLFQRVGGLAGWFMNGWGVGVGEAWGQG